MKTPPLHILEEISDRLRQAVRVSEAAEQAAQKTLHSEAEAQDIFLLYEEAVSLERVAAMLRVIGWVYTDKPSCVGSKRP